MQQGFCDVFSDDGDPPLGTSIDITETLVFPGGHFLLHHVDARLGDTVTRSLEIFAWDRSAKVVVGRSHDDLGRIELSTISLRNGSIKITGDAIRFSGTFSQDKRVITGRWQRKTDAGAWVRFMNVTLARVP